MEQKFKHRVNPVNGYQPAGSVCYKFTETLAKKLGFKNSLVPNRTSTDTSISKPLFKSKTFGLFPVYTVPNQAIMAKASFHILLNIKAPFCRCNKNILFLLLL